MSVKTGLFSEVGSVKLVVVALIGGNMSRTSNDPNETNDTGFCEFNGGHEVGENAFEV
jgi:hypothetical protein